MGQSLTNPKKAMPRFSTKSPIPPLIKKPSIDWTKYASGAAASRPDSFSGMDPEFASTLHGALSEFGGKLTVGSGYRSQDLQDKLFANSDGSGKWVAKVSNHTRGNAADLFWEGKRLDKVDKPTRDMIHNKLSERGLGFRMSYEPWHVEPTGPPRPRSTPKGLTKNTTKADAPKASQDNKEEEKGIMAMLENMFDPANMALAETASEPAPQAPRPQGIGMPMQPSAPHPQSDQYFQKLMAMLMGQQ